MSYNDGWDQVPSSYSVLGYGWQATPMAFDIAARPAIYGANVKYETGGNVYTLPKVNGPGTFWSGSWDARGIDEITAAGATGGCKLKLSDAPLPGPNAGGFVSHVDGIIGG